MTAHAKGAAHVTERRNKDLAVMFDITEHDRDFCAK